MRHRRRGRHRTARVYAIYFAALVLSSCLGAYVRDVVATSELHEARIGASLVAGLVLIN
jgi:hypothetical protein